MLGCSIDIETSNPSLWHEFGTRQNKLAPIMISSYAIGVAFCSETDCTQEAFWKSVSPCHGPVTLGPGPRRQTRTGPGCDIRVTGRHHGSEPAEATQTARRCLSVADSEAAPATVAGRPGPGRRMDNGPENRRDTQA